MTVAKYGTTALKQVDGKPRISAMPYLYDISEGNVSDHAPWRKTGHNGDVDTGEEDIWSVGGTYVWPTANMGMEIVSSAAADNATGTGVQSVQIYYLTSAGVEKSEVLATNGTTPVPTVATDIFRVQTFRAHTIGTGLRAAGNIDIRHISDSPIYSRIATGLTRARNSAWRVPANKTLYITSCAFSGIGSASGKDVQFIVRSTYDDASKTIVGFFLPFIEIGTMDGSFFREFEMPIMIPSGTDIIVAAIAGNNDTRCTSSLRGWTE
jgi:hypothetical protein